MATFNEFYLSNIASWTKVQIKVLESRFGLPADIYYPVNNSTLLDDNSEFIYNSVPDETKNILIIGIYSPPFQGQPISEVLSQDDEVIWYLSGDDTPPPLNSKVIVHLNSVELHFQVSYVKADSTRSGGYYEIYLTRVR